MKRDTEADSCPIRATHEVTNQPSELADYDLFETDLALAAAARSQSDERAVERLSALGMQLGARETIQLGFEANQYSPELAAFDRFGNRVDEVRYHPAWHTLMAIAVENGIHNDPWKEEREDGDTGRVPHVARSAKHYMLSQIEAGVCCPITMTFACVPALRNQPEIWADWKPHLLDNRYDPALAPLAEKKGVLVGMAMTEKQGGSDVRSNTTSAAPQETSGPGKAYTLIGHKWFCSAPMSDAFLTLAQTGRGLSCFLVPRVLPDGTRNPLRIQRLKNKLGNRSNASSEIEYPGTTGWMLGEDGQGIRTIIEMVHHTRLDCISGSAGLMRAALAQALHHARHRKAFGRFLIEQPLMTNVLADLAIEVEGAVALMTRVAAAYDGSGDEQERAFARIATAIGKYWVCKRAPAMIYEAMECLGGNGYVEEAVLARLYREAPVNSIWEGSGNVMCLDVLRALGREPGALTALLAEVDAARGADTRLDRAAATLREELSAPAELEFAARRIVELMATCLQASLLIRTAPAAVSDAFCASRLAGTDNRLVFGGLPAGADCDRIIERAGPWL